MTPRIRNIFCGVLLAAQTLTACTGWQVVQVSPRALVDSAHVRSMRITEKGGVRTVLESPRVSGDSLTGTVVSTARVNSFSGKVSYPPYAAHQILLAAAERVEVRKTNLGLILLIPGILVVAILMACADDPGWVC